LLTLRPSAERSAVSVDTKKKELVGNFKNAGRHPSGLAVSRDALAAVRLRPDSFHGDWNYTILPTPSAKR
jgi:hypothetical protein